MNWRIFTEIIFGASVAALVYAYLGYPVLVWLVSLARPLSIKKSEIEPTVTILITAYNEEKILRQKIQNTFKLDYPKEKLEILVASDGSTDATDKIAREFADSGVKLFRQEGRKGKTYTQNKAVEICSGEIIIFSDATTMYEKNILREILPNFSDETIGCVAGKLIYVDDTDSDVGSGAKKYWGYETFIKERESLACSLIGASGCLYGVRRSAYRPMYPEACSDFVISTVLYRQNLRTVFEPNAVCTEETNRQTGKELQMRVRVISQTIYDLWINRDMLNPLRNGFFAIELWSHKILRYAVPLFLVLIFISSILLAFSSVIFLVSAAVQTAFYLSAFAAWLLEKAKVKTGLLAIPLYFVLANAASAIAFYRFLRGEKIARWEPIRDSLEEEHISAV